MMTIQIRVDEEETSIAVIDVVKNEQGDCCVV